MLWFYLALGAGIASAINVGSSKLLVAKHVSPIIIGGVVHLMGGLLCCLSLFLVTPSLQINFDVLLGLFFMAVTYTLGNALYFSALTATQLSEIDLYLRTSSLWTFLGGIVLLQESAAPGTLLGAVLILISIALLARQSRPLRFHKAQLLALAAAVSFGAGNIIDKSLSIYFDPLSYTTLNLLLTGLGMLMIARTRLRDLRMPVLWGPTAWTVAATFALTQLLIILAFQAGGSAGQVILVAQVRLIILIVVGIMLLREHDRLWRKLAAAALMVAGMYSLY